jgi:hypothetical protein
MRILFQVTATPLLRHFTDVVLTLTRRGHHVQVACVENPDELPVPAALKGQERIEFVLAPAGRSDAWRTAAEELRALRDYVRYLEQPFTQASKLRGRAFRKAVKTLSDDAHRHVSMSCPHCREDVSDAALIGALLEKYPGAPAGLARRLDLIESAIPSDRGIDAFLRDARPDAVLVTPLVRTGSHQAEYVKSARALGIPVGFPVFSWDNLSTKGLIHVQPDRVYVWNEVQKTEAIDMHRVPAERVVVTGAPRFDRFFAMHPEASRQQFCDANGLEASRPMVTYLCSSEFVAETEREFVMQWIDEVRRHPGLAGCNIVIRPHPRQKAQWKGFDTGRGHVAVTFPQSINSDQLLYDTLHYSAAVVGLNTSAQLEAGIVGRPVLTILAPEFADGQSGTLHFHYLLRQHGGFVECAPDFESHRSQLSAAVEGRYNPAAIREFVDAFLRPCGRDREVAPILADAVEELARTGPPRAWRRVLAGAQYGASRAFGPPVPESSR